MLTEQEIREALHTMESNPLLLTKPSFRADTEKWPNNEISFVENHLAYLRLHPKTNPSHYLSNLRLMLRKR